MPDQRQTASSLARKALTTLGRTMNWIFRPFSMFLWLLVGVLFCEKTIKTVENECVKCQRNKRTQTLEGAICAVCLRARHICPPSYSCQKPLFFGKCVKLSQWAKTNVIWTWQCCKHWLRGRNLTRSEQNIQWWRQLAWTSNSYSIKQRPREISR